MEEKGVSVLLIGIIVVAVVAVIAVGIAISNPGPGNDQNAADLNQPVSTAMPTPLGMRSVPDQEDWETGTGQPAETQGDSCTTADGSTGLTGPSAVEGVLFKWDFESIQSGTCGTTDQNMIFFCDPTQFSLSLANRLEQIKKLAESGKTEKARALTEFDSLLIADNYSEDFQKDFADYYSGKFFETPTWFGPWAKYFADENKLQFGPRNIKSQGSGLYKVKLNFEFEGKEFEFFKDKMPAAKITVEFSRLGEYTGNPSIFHSIPINGMVGTTRKDKDGKTERKDYGIGFSENSQTLVFQESDKKIVDSTAKGGLKEFQILIQDKFEQTNTKGGVIAFINESGGIMTFAPQYAKTVLALLNPKNGSADLFYWISENGKGIGQGKTSMAWWTAAGSAPLQKFQSLVPDASAKSTTACKNVDATGGNAFGFHVTGFRPDQNMLLESYFFTPFQNNVVLENGCPETALLFTENEKIPSRQLTLSGTENKISQFYELHDLAMKREICVVNKQGATYFQWNEAVLKEQERKALENAGIKAESTEEITQKGITVEPVQPSDRKITMQKYELFSGTDGGIKVLFTPAAETDGEVYLVADAARGGLFCSQKAVVEIYRVNEKNEESLLKKESGFLSWLWSQEKEYRGSIKKGESLKLTATGFTKTLCSGSGSAEAYIAYAAGTSGIAVAVETKEILGGYCAYVWLAEYPDTQIEKCTINWGDEGTTSTTELWPGPNVEPGIGPHIRSHCYESPGERTVFYECSEGGTTKSAELSVKTPQYPEGAGLLEGEDCTNCPTCCDASLNCSPADEAPESSQDYEGDYIEGMVCCPKDTKWDGELCLDISKYAHYFRVNEYSGGDAGELFLGLDSWRFSGTRDLDMEAFLERQRAAHAAGGDDKEKDFSDYGEKPEDLPADQPWPPEWPSEESGWQEGENSEEAKSEIQNVKVEIYFGGNLVDSIDLSQEERWAGELNSLAGSLEFGAVWNTKGMGAGEYITKFYVSGGSFRIIVDRRFSIDESGSIIAGSPYSLA
ncbi:MAG: hypothetical protein V1493_06410 [Candidatus Diapherotrites archaeon]